MPPIFKIMLIILGVAPLLRLMLTAAVVSCGTAVILWSSIACGFMGRSLACFVVACMVVAYSSFSLLTLAFARKRTAERLVNNVQWRLMRNAVVRLVGMFNY